MKEVLILFILFTKHITAQMPNDGLTSHSLNPLPYVWDGIQARYHQGYGKGKGGRTWGIKITIYTGKYDPWLHLGDRQRHICNL